MKLLTTKSILDELTEAEADTHNEEISALIERLQGKDPWTTEYLMTRKYQDKAHKELAPYQQIINGYEIYEAIEGCDFKNGCDAFLNSAGSVVIRVYGQGYMIKESGEYHLVVTDIEFKEEKEGK